MTFPHLGKHASGALVGGLCLMLAACGGSDDDNGNSAGNSGDNNAALAAPTATLLSSRPEYVSGGNTLIDITLPALPAGTAAPTLKVTVNDVDASGAFKADPANPGHMIGLVSGLKDGDNSISASYGGTPATLKVTNYPIVGPMFSGPRITPFVCQTGTLSLPDGTHLQGKPDDPTCSAPTNVQYVYRSTANTYKPLADPKTLPADLATITKANGETVPYIVRVETTTIDRGISQITMLFDPARDAEPSPTARPRNWNGRLVYGHGTGCVGGWYIQGGAWGYNPLNDTWLSRGYAVASNTLNHPTNSCNPVVSGEAATMTKEYFIERYGAPAFTMTVGTSGGAYSSLQLADTFPGLFDGVFVDATFPDALAIAMSGMDAHLLSNYFLGGSTSAASFTPAQQAAVSGYANPTAMVANGNQMGRTDPVPGRTAPTFTGVGNYASAVFNSAVPTGLRYNPTGASRNFAGARPTVFDANVNVYGKAKNPLDPSGTSTYALRPYDNVGVQYGLKALNAGLITPAQFLDLNQAVGGYDIDANPVPTRSVGDAGAMQRAYQAGLMLSGGGGLASLPIMDTTAIYSEDTSNYHMQWEHFAVRERLIQANGNADNQVMWRGGPAASPISTGNALAISTFEQWMEKIVSDKAAGNALEKVLRNKPAAAVDGCFDASSKFIAEKQTLGVNNSTCNTLFPSYTMPRYQAGGPIAANVFKCQLKPVSAADYTVTFTAPELARLNAIFPSGTCDWTKPGVSQTKVQPWPSVGPSALNRIFDVTAQQ
jgi:hypothetical protein